jgi:hypothetical protein
LAIFRSGLRHHLFASFIGCAPKAAELGSSNFKANIRRALNSSLNIEPSPQDVGFGEVLHAVLTGLWRRKLLMGAIVTAPAMS